MNSNLRSWILCLALNLFIGGYFGYALMSQASVLKGNLLPGETTHGHYQIELNCSACHSPSEGNQASGSISPVMQDSCIGCHQSQLDLVDDTHPATKFNDPTSADMLQILDAQNCLSCHQEHVPEQTRGMGLTVPQDYCWHCHQEVGETRASHADMTFDSCATAGCHNYHDNRALYEGHLNKHFGEPDFFSTAAVPPRNFSQAWKSDHADIEALPREEADGPKELEVGQVLEDWSETKHAAAGVNCTQCHVVTDGDAASWDDAVSLETCQKCHERESESFLMGKHGMRLRMGMPAKTPATARLEMHAGASHRKLTCSACHQDHRFDTQFAAVEACQGCHADAHSTNYQDSSHAELWRREIAGDAEAGTGVSCATCHLPRVSDGDSVWVNHNQNANLQPNESMARQVCQSCHGLEFSLSVLAESELMATCYDRAPTVLNESVKMAHEWFEQQRIKREAREKNRKR